MTGQLEHIVKQCKREDTESQKALYDMYKDLLYAICIRYVKNEQDAEDVFIEGFFKILTKISDYKGDGSFEGWMRKIMVNESLMFLRKKANLHMTVEIPDKDIADVGFEEESDITAEDIIKILDELPVGYRTVFNLYVFEDFKHREIAEMLGISINTSKSQLILAKKRVHEILKKKVNPINKLLQ